MGLWECYRLVTREIKLLPEGKKFLLECDEALEEDIILSESALTENVLNNNSTNDELSGEGCGCGGMEIIFYDNNYVCVTCKRNDGC